MERWADDLSRVAIELWKTTLAYLPKIVGALLLLLLGWLAARLLQKLIHRTVRKVGRWGSIEGDVRAAGVDDMAPKVLSSIAFWVVFLVFTAAAGQALGLAVISGVLRKLSEYLPHVLSGVIVVLAGVVVGNLVRRTVRSAAAAARVTHAQVLGDVARIGILAIAGVIALEQLGIHSNVLVVAFGLVIGGGVAGMALAFGLGCRDTVRDLIAGRELGRLYRPGQMVRVGELQGRIIRVERHSVTLDTADGKARIPAGIFAGSTAVLLDEEG